MNVNYMSIQLLSELQTFVTVWTWVFLLIHVNNFNMILQHCHCLKGLKFRHFNKKLYFNPGLYCDDNIDTTEEDIAIISGDAIVEESVKEVVEKLRNLNQIK